MPWRTEGRKTNPAAGTLLADTGPLQGGVSYSPQLVVSSTVILQVRMEHRDAENLNTLQEHTFLVPANSSFQFSVWGYFDILEGQRVRLTVGANVTGTAQGSLFW